MGKTQQYSIVMIYILMILVRLKTTEGGAWHHAESLRESWYTKYPKYPPYCSTPDQMKARAVPPLEDHQNSLFGETRILHVTALIRHGARTPFTGAPKYSCWDSYWTDIETSIWDCDLTTLMAPPMLETIEEEEGLPTQNDNDDNDLAFFLFEKRFDALRYPEDGLTNKLNGTCQLGQLILHGYEQEITNGIMLRSAYLWEDDGSYDHDARMRLIQAGIQFDIDSNVARVPWDDVKYRCDDDQRTVMSGQVLLRGLFDQEVMSWFYETGVFPIIHTHTADKSRDILSPHNFKVCPKLEVLQNDALQSDEYQEFNNSESIQNIRIFVRDNLGNTSNMDVLVDCLMTTICTDRPLPDAINDYGEEGSKFEEIAELNTVLANKVYSFNNSAFAKLAMMPLWVEIMNNIRPWLQKDIDSREEVEDPPKLALFSGHDSTLKALLMTLGQNLHNETDWPPYASMLLIEIHELIDGQADKTIYKSDYAFRLIFNGNILTNLISGCPSDAELCDVTHLLDIVDPYTNQVPDCSVPTAEEPTDPLVVKTQKLMSTKEGVLLVLGLVLISAIFGALGTFRILTGRYPCTRKSSVSYTVVEEERIGLQENESEDGEHNGFEDEPIEEDDGEFVNGGTFS